MRKNNVCLTKVIKTNQMRKNDESKMFLYLFIHLIFEII